MFKKDFKWFFGYKILLANGDSNETFFRVTVLLTRQKQLRFYIPWNVDGSPEKNNLTSSKTCILILHHVQYTGYWFFNNILR